MPEDVKASDYQDQLSPTARSILAEANMNPGASPNKVTMEETPWQGRYPNLYGVVGAAKEVGKSLLPYIKYIDPAEREKFMQLDQQQQVRDLLLEDLNFVTLGRWKPIAAFGKEVAGAAMQTFLPKTYEALTKARKIPGFKSVIPEVKPEASTPKTDVPTAQTKAVAAESKLAQEEIDPLTLRRDELYALYEKKLAAEKNADLEVFGSKERLDQYNKAQRMANSSDPARAKKGQDIVDEMEASLSQSQQNKLYGIGEKYVADDLKGLINAADKLDFTSPEALGQSLRYAATRVGKETDLSKMTATEREAFYQLKIAFDEAQLIGWDTKIISNEMIQAAGSRFSDPIDAEFMLNRFKKSETFQSNQGSSVPELAKTTETDIIPSVTTPKGTANIPPETTPKAVGGYGNYTKVSDAIRMAKDSGQSGKYYIRIDPKDYKEGDILPRSRKWIDGEPTEKIYAGTSAINPAGPFKRHFNQTSDELTKYEGNVYLVKGKVLRRGYDDGEVILKDATVIKSIPNPSRPPEVGGRASATQAATSPTDTPVVEAAKGAADVPPGSTPKPKAEAVPPAAPEAAPAIDVPVVDSDETFKSVKALSEKWDEIIDTQRRGVRPHELAREEAKNIGYTYDEIKNMVPGTTLNDSQVVALTNTIKGVADEVLTAAQSGDTQLFLKKFLALGEVDPARWGVKTEAGRTLSIMNEPISGINQYLDQFSNALQGGNITPERLMGMVSKLKTPAQLAELAKAAQRPGFTDAVLEVWINGLLSSPVSHMANILGNAGMVAIQVPERGIAAAIGKVLPGEAQVKIGEVPEMVYGMLEGMKDGFRLAGKALMEGKPQTGAEKIEWNRSFIAETFGLKDDSGLGKAINLLGEAIRTPGRALLSADEFFKGVSGRMELRSRAYREGVANGFEREDLGKFIADEMNKPGQQTKNAVSQFQKYITFQSELGKSGQAFQDFVASHPSMKMIFPFVKTPANIFKTFGERTPLGIFSKNIRSDIAAGGAQRDLALARMSLGTTISGITAAYVADGTITGGGPADKNLRAAMMREGWQPYSIRIGKEYYSYARLEPFATLIGATASAVELMGQTESGDIEADEIPAAVISAISRNVLDKLFMQGMSNIILAIEEPKQFGKQYIYQLTGSVVPGFSAQLSRSIEGDVKQINSIMDSVKSRVPGFSSDVPSKVNLWGEKIEIETFGPMMISPIRKSSGEGAAIDREIVRNKISIAPPDKQIFGVELTPKEYNRYAILAGNEAKGTNGLGLKESLTKLINTPDYIRQSDGSEGGKSLMIKAQVTYYRELAALKMLQEYPELEAAVKLKQIEKQQNIRPKY